MLRQETHISSGPLVTSSLSSHFQARRRWPHLGAYVPAVVRRKECFRFSLTANAVQISKSLIVSTVGRSGIHLSTLASIDGPYTTAMFCWREICLWTLNSSPTLTRPNGTVHRPRSSRDRRKKLWTSSHLPFDRRPVQIWIVPRIDYKFGTWRRTELKWFETLTFELRERTTKSAWSVWTSPSTTVPSQRALNVADRLAWDPSPRDHVTNALIDLHYSLLPVAACIEFKLCVRQRTCVYFLYAATISCIYNHVNPLLAKQRINIQQ